MKTLRNLRMLKTSMLLCMVLTAVFLFSARTARAANYTVSFSNATCYVGETVNISMTITPETASIEIKLAYSADLLQMTGYSGGLGNANITYNANSISINDYASNGAKSATYTFTFKTLKAGSGWVRVSEVIEITDAAGDPQPSSVANSAAVTINQKPTASSEARLESLTVVPGKWNQSFSPDVKEYSISLDTYTPELTFQFKSKESHAQVIYWPYSKPGKIALETETTNFYIKSTAQDGQTAILYHFLITRPPKPTEPPTVPPTEPPTQPPTVPPTEPPTQPIETTPEETTPEETTEAVPVIRIPAQAIEIMPFPEGFEIPEGYQAEQMTDEDGTAFDGLVPADGDRSHCLVYGAKDGEEPDLYAFFEEEKFLRLFSLMTPETSE